MDIKTLIKTDLFVLKHSGIIYFTKVVACIFNLYVETAAQVSFCLLSGV